MVRTLQLVDVVLNTMASEMSHGRWHDFEECGRMELRNPFRRQDNFMVADLERQALVGFMNRRQSGADFLNVPCLFPKWLFLVDWDLLPDLTMFASSPPCWKFSVWVLVSRLVPVSTLGVCVPVPGLGFYTIWFICPFICMYMHVLRGLLVCACKSKLRLGFFLSQLPFCILRQILSLEFSIWHFS